MSFLIYTMIPRQRISKQDSICNINTSTLVVEEDDSVLKSHSWLDVHTSEIAVEVFKLCLDFALTFNPYFYADREINWKAQEVVNPLRYLLHLLSSQLLMFHSW